MLILCSFSDGNQKFPACFPAGPVNPKHETLVGVVPFIKRPHKADAWLNGHDAARPCGFLHAWLGPWHLFFPDKSLGHARFIPEPGFHQALNQRPLPHVTV